MNKRIQELMIQSNPHGDFTGSEWVFERFAELIVKECDLYVREKFETFQCIYPGVLLKHFGVEE
jgi:hypothetical protein